MTLLAAEITIRVAAITSLVDKILCDQDYFYGGKNNFSSGDDYFFSGLDQFCSG